MKKQIVIGEDALRKRYCLRRTGKNWLSWETTIPREVIEREARRLGVPLDKIENLLEVEWLFGDFTGLYMRLVSIASKKGSR
jgi:hypothetical protein